MRLGDRSLARALGMRAAQLRDLLASSSWDSDSVQLVVAGLYGARLLALSQGHDDFDRRRVSSALLASDTWLDRSVRAALAPDAPVGMASAVDEVIAMLAASSEAAPAADSGSLLSFYEPFLHAYDPAQRKARGVYFTPPPLAAYLVARVDQVLSRELGRNLIDDPAVCALDPAAGVGAFLTAWIWHAHARFAEQALVAGLDVAAKRDAWQRYVPASLLPRMIGFELLPAAHALLHLQVRLTLAGTGYLLRGDERIEVHCADALALLAKFDARERGEQRDTTQDAALDALARASVVIGNPPYARGKKARDAFWEAQLEVYKEPVRAEKNLQPLADDYLRFFRFTEHLLARGSFGVAGLISSSTFLDGHLHRGVRASLSRSFSCIDVLDLGGSAKRSARDASRERDANLFQVSQGIALSVLRRGSSPAATRVRYAKLRGSSEAKLRALRELDAVTYAGLAEQAGGSFVPSAPVPAEYASFIALDQLFSWSSIAAKPGQDALLVAFERDELLPRLESFRRAARADASLAATEGARLLRGFDAELDASRVVPYAYRPFDTRFVYDDPRIWTRPVRRLRARLNGEPMLLSTRLAQDGGFAHVFATRLLPDVIFLSNKSSVNTFAFPESALSVEAASTALGTPVDRPALFAYTYATLHAPSYRQRYAAALARALARVPLTRDRAMFEQLAGLGARLLALHLGETLGHASTDGPRFVAGAELRVERASLAGAPQPDANGQLRVPINASSRFEAIPEATWELRVGGHQVCHKWLLDRARAGREIDATQAAHYCGMVDALTYTRQLMHDIDAVIAACGGFPAAFVVA